MRLSESCVVGGVIAALLLAGRVSSAETASAENGKTLWTTSCKACHESPRMLTMLGVKDPTTVAPTALGRVDKETFVKVIKNGKGKMKPLPKLTDAQIESLYSYLQGLTPAKKAP